MDNKVVMGMLVYAGVSTAPYHPNLMQTIAHACSHKYTRVRVYKIDMHSMIYILTFLGASVVVLVSVDNLRGRA